MDSLDLDQILRDIGGFSYYQIKRFILVFLVLAFTAFPTFSFIFTTLNVRHRCFVNECDDPRPNFDADWVKRAIPFKENEPRKCLRYVNPHPTGNCSDTYFNKAETVRCDDFVFENGTKLTLANDFGIHCEEDHWKLSLVGTINNLGYLIGLPLSGLFSDRFGRLKIMTFSICACVTFGLVKSFSPNYISYVIAEFLETFLGGGVYGAAYILGMELLTSEYRVIGSTIMSCAYAAGAALMGFVAWHTFSWRTFLRILYTPSIIFISYYWLMDESVRWLLANEKKVAAKKVLKRIAWENNSELQNNTIKVLNIVKEDKTVEEKRIDSFAGVFQSPVLFVRLLNCLFVWICCAFVYYGLTMHSVGISGNMYINYIAVALIEIPAYTASNFSLSRLGRKYSLSISLLLSGMACIGFVFTPEGDRTLRLILFLLGKFSVTVAFTSIYLHTTEMFPTSFRHSIISLCSGFSRIGSMIAPQVLLLAQVWKSLPTIIFGVIAVLAGLLSIVFPETLNTNLPDSLEEAELLGKANNKSTYT